MPNLEILREHLMEKVLCDVQTQCWVFTGALNCGYGQLSTLSDRGRLTTIRTHRLAWELFVGPLAADLQIHHLCENKACCNPAHLTPLKDLDHKRADKNWVGNRTHCKRGHELSGDNVSPAMLKRGIRRCKQCSALKMREARAVDPEATRRKGREAMKKWIDKDRQRNRDYQRERRIRLKSANPSV